MWFLEECSPPPVKMFRRGDFYLKIISLVSIEMSDTMTETIINTDIHIVKDELFDVDRMNIILRDTSGTYSKRDLVNLSRYNRSKKTGNCVPVIYHYGRGFDKAQLGRLFARDNNGIQSFPCHIRNPLLEKHYWDCDMVNAHYVILSKLADSWGLKTEAIRQYVSNRDVELQRVSSNRRIAKTAFLKVAYGGSVKLHKDEYSDDGISPEGDISLLKRIEAEMRVIVDNCWMKYEQHQKLVKKKDNPKFSLFALILQTEERKCLMLMDEFMKLNKRQMDIFIHDGGEIRKLEGEKEFPSTLLRGAEQYVAERTGYPIELVVKPFTHSFQDPDSSTSYDTIKKTFEENHFKLMTPPCYVRVINKKLHMLNKSELNMLYENMYYDTSSPFITKWLADKSIRTYEELVFKPKQDIKDTQYNLFQGFETEPIAGDITAVKTILNLISNNDTDVANYIEKMMAHIVQKPYEKTGKVLIIYSPEEGAGKDTYFDLMGRILGQYFYNTANAETAIFGRFKAHWKQALLVKMEELSFVDTKSHFDCFKSLITAPTLDFEEKGKGSVNLDNYTTFVGTTNNDISVKVTDTNRRFVFVKASPERVGDIEFWDKIQPILHSSETASAYLHHLLSIDLTDFKVRDSPVTEYALELKDAFIPYTARFFQREIEDNGTLPNLNYEGYVLLSSLKGVDKFERSDTKIGRDLKVFSDAGVLVKRRSANGIKYRVDRNAMEKFLREKKWWYELPIQEEM